MYYQIYTTYLSVLKYVMLGGFNYLILLIFLSLFRITQLLKFLIPIKVFFELNDNGALTNTSIALLTVLVLALVIEATYQFFNQSLRYKIAIKYLSKIEEQPKLTVLNFT